MIDNYDEKMENESYPDNSILIFENTFFDPHEISFRKGI